MKYKITEYLEQPSHQIGMSHLDLLSILFARNKNSLLITHIGPSVDGFGLNADEAAQLSYYSGVIQGCLFSDKREKDEMFIIDKVINPLIANSKKFGFNIGTSEFEVKQMRQGETGVLVIKRNRKSNNFKVN